MADNEIIKKLTAVADNAAAQPTVPVLKDAGQNMDYDDNNHIHGLDEYTRMRMKIVVRLLT